MKIYTRTGDQGQTGLIGGARVRKDHPRVAAYGDVDELNCWLGWAAAALPKASPPLRATLARLQEELFHLGAALATPPERSPRPLPGAWARRLESEIDEMTAELPALRNFILPGGAEAGCRLHLARAACRRAERAVVALGAEAPAGAVLYLNRLSDHLFTAARWANRRARAKETVWKGS